MSTNNQTDDDKPRLSSEQKQKMKKYAVFALMGIICAGCMWLIFAPSAEEKAQKEAQAGFNAEIPDPKNAGIVGDKATAYEQEQVKQKQAERMRSLNDFSALLGEDGKKQTDELPLLPDEPAKTGGGVSSTSKSTPVQNSVNAYRDINRNLGSFYEKPREDPEKERLKEELEDLKARMEETESRKNSTENQLALMEKSFQMAAKYMPGMSGTQGTPPSVATTEPANVQENARAKGNASGKTAAMPVCQVQPQTVSLLQAEMSGAEFIETYSQERNLGFVTATAEAGAVTKNTILACINENQSVMDGQSVRLRLIEPMRAGNMFVPRNTLLSGTAKIQGERLGVTVNFLEYRGAILPVELKVYDLDGMQGIFIPNLQELNAAKEIVANMGTSAGTSINLSNDAGEQFVADMGRNLIQGVSQFTAKKLREVKVNLKAGYRVFLLPEENINNQQLASNL
ncbi:MAG: conjugative transposon protein TraM [Dysgonamonadaceae bacterium]|jgi:conjugative transposon TraM protein|nr:conjugative transposon protein TraM [Dysgonamonadaceae bacterium]